MGIRIEKQKEDYSEWYANVDKILKKDISFSSAFPSKTKESLYAEMHTLLKSGINLKVALEIIVDSKTKAKELKVLKGLYESIIKGDSLAEAMEKQGVFTAYEIKTLEIGEKTGMLAEVSKNLNEYFAKKNDRKRQIISAMMYPIIVFVTAFVVVFFMLKYVIPMFEDIFKQNNTELPWMTKFLISLSHVLRENGTMILLFIILCIIAFKLLKKVKAFMELQSKLILKIPLIGPYFKLIHMTRFVHMMSLILEAKVSFNEALEMTGKVLKFPPLNHGIIEANLGIRQGEKISLSFQKNKFFDKKLITLLTVAEETNQTEFIFQKLYQQYATDLEYRSKSISNLLNPILTLLIGLIVGLILISLYLPMFKLSTVIG